jgi:hypothetical protein
MKVKIAHIIVILTVFSCNTQLASLSIKKILSCSIDQAASINNKKLRFFQWKKIHTGKYE